MMKIFKILTLMVAGMLMLAGCSKDETPSTVSKKITDGQWKVTYYWDKDKDETYKFNGYTFLFKSDQTIEVNTGSGMAYGTWLFDTSDDSHDHFIITMPTTDPLDDLTDDWEVIKITDTDMELKDVSGSGGTEYLTFKKN